MKKLLLTMFSILMLSACQETPTLKGRTFALDTNKNFTITFDAKDDKFYGKAVNNYFGTYKIENSNLTLNLGGSTMMMGPMEEMQQEQTYFQNLSKIKTYAIQNKTLELKGDNVTLKYFEQ